MSLRVCLKPTIASTLRRQFVPSASFISLQSRSYSILDRATMSSPAPVPQRRFQNPAVFVCDIQEKFRPAIHEFDKVIATTSKLLRASSILSLPVFVTTQNRARLGDTVSELKPHLAAAAVKADIDKTRFSMFIPPLLSDSVFSSPAEVAIVGIESHICVTQTALDLLQAGHKVYILADGVSSTNKEEVPIALARLRQAGAVVTSSESWIYELMGDAAVPEFKGIVNLVKDTGKETRGALGGLLGSKI
ncbi:Isochorismatase-like protein [Triangularia setosa]|uniref:Isochorismatase-like protein n=1 Tax=Triangularia setosa TaxID=2587417 RepID=A0AAN7A7S5_9PEZI|nr:Isochorismatase-like protein [Podospora setosa]